MGSTATYGQAVRPWSYGSNADASRGECGLVTFGWRVISLAGAGILGLCLLVSQWLGDDDGEVVDPLASEVSTFAVVAA